MYKKSSPETIQAMFGSIAAQYDRANAILSFRMHKRWNRALVNEVTRQAEGPLLDLCCGTGDIAFDYLNRFHQSKTVYMLDFCQEMLQEAKKKERRLPYRKHNLHYLAADAQAIPLESESVSLSTIAYGIRNVKNPLLCLCDVYRILKPGGVLGVLELTQPINPVLRFGHKAYLSTLLPVLGRLITSNQDAYRYLCNSIQNFIKPIELEGLFADAGFVNTKRIPLVGGIATIITGQKPVRPND